MPLEQSVPWAVEDPDDQALLIAQQHLAERGFAKAVAAIEQQTGKKYLASKLPRGSMLLEMVYKQMEEDALQDKDAQEASCAAAEDAELLRTAAPLPPMHLQLAVEGVLQSAVTSLVHSSDGSAVYTGTGDGRVRRVHLESGDIQWATDTGSGGVLSLALMAPQPSGEEPLVAGRMDGSIAVLSAGSGALLAKAQVHRKYVVAVAALSGSLFVTASWDRTVKVHSISEDGHLIETVATQEYDDQVADIAVLDMQRVAVAIKNTCYLHVFQHSTQEDCQFNLNDHQWDEHLSFSATALALQPDGRFLFVSTDGPRMLILRTRDMQQQRVLYGLQTEAQFHVYAAVWLGSTGYVAAAAVGGQVCIFAVGSGKVVFTLDAHKGSNVRCMVFDAQRSRLVTGSFDRSLKVFGCG